MATDTPAREMSRRGLVGGASAAIISQGIVAASSLALQWFALAELGNVGLGIFALLAAGVMVTATAIHTGWIGDPLVLLDRFDPGVRRALFRASYISAALSFVGGFLCALVLTDIDVVGGVIFGVALVVWLVEETIRRLLMARLEFVKLAVNDAVYGIGALGTAGAVMVSGDLTMRWVLTAMAVGSVASIVVGVIQLPHKELALPSPGPASWATLREASLWRSGQLMMRPFGMLIVRWAISLLVSTAALGVMEAARLVIAPILTAANGFGGFTLPFYTRKRDSASLGVRLIVLFTTASTAIGLAYVPIAIFITGPFERLSDSDPIPMALAVSWALYAVVYAANIPIVNALTALLYSKTVFVGRVIDTVVIVVASLAIVAIDADAVRFVPLVMAAGIVVGTAWPVWVLWRKGALANPSAITPAELRSTQASVAGAASAS